MCEREKIQCSPDHFPAICLYLLHYDTSFSLMHTLLICTKHDLFSPIVFVYCSFSYTFSSNREVVLVSMALANKFLADKLFSEAGNEAGV